MDEGDKTIVSFLLGLLGIGLIILRIWMKGGTTVTRPDGSTGETGATDFYTPRPDESAGAVLASRKRQIGPTTISFSYINQRHAMVNDLKQKYGSAVRIVHRGKKSDWDTWTGLRNVYTLIYEVPAKCPKCKDSFSIEDFGLVDCPSCGTELAVGFDSASRKKLVLPTKVEAVIPAETHRVRDASLRAETEPKSTTIEITDVGHDRLAERFKKIE